MHKQAQPKGALRENGADPGRAKKPGRMGQWDDSAPVSQPQGQIHYGDGLKGLRFAFAGNYAAHGRAMQSLYLQALILAVVFTFLPGRLMNAVLFGQSPEAGFGIVAALGVLAIALIWRAPSLRRALR